MKGLKGTRGTRFEVSTNTRDSSLQLVFADPYASLTQLGIAIPAAVPNFYPTTQGATPQPWANRYLILLASQGFTYGQVARLVGMRQRVLIGTTVGGGEGHPDAIYPTYIAQTTPEWHFSDANISWHLRRVPLEKRNVSNANNAAEQQFRQAQNPAVLFENPPGVGAGYAPAFAGQPPGNVLSPEFGTFHDLRFPWATDQAWRSVDMEFEGPCRIEFYASVQQTDPDTRPNINDTGITAAQLLTLPPEEQYVAAFEDAIYTRIAGSLIFEMAAMHKSPRAMIECGTELTSQEKPSKRPSVSGPSRSPSTSPTPPQDPGAAPSGRSK
jgi:hypothetical protein